MRVWWPYLLWWSTDENWGAFQAINEDRDQLLQERRVYWTRNIVLQVVAELSSCFHSDFEVCEDKVKVLFYMRVEESYQNQSNLIAEQRCQWYSVTWLPHRGLKKALKNVDSCGRRMCQQHSATLVVVWFCKCFLALLCREGVC